MPTQRTPFFASFFGAFRARTNPTFQAKSSTPSSSITPSSLVSSAHVSTTAATVTSSASTARTASTVTDNHSATQVSQPTAVSSSKPANATPFSAATFTSTSPGTHFYPRSPGSSSPIPHNATNLSMSPPGSSTPLTRGRQRRGSDSSNSSGGFMDALGSPGAEKWYIGGRTGAGDERFYRLGLVTSASGKRVRSLDRLSL